MKFPTTDADVIYSALTVLLDILNSEKKERKKINGMIKRRVQSVNLTERKSCQTTFLVSPFKLTQICNFINLKIYKSNRNLINLLHNVIYILINNPPDILYMLN